MAEEMSLSNFVLFSGVGSGSRLENPEVGSYHLDVSVIGQTVANVRRNQSCEPSFLPTLFLQQLSIMKCGAKFFEVIEIFDCVSR